MKWLPLCLLAGLASACAGAGSQSKDGGFATGYQAQEGEVPADGARTGAEAAPHAAEAGADEVAGAEPAAEPLSWITDEALALRRARSEGKGVILDFRADWCGPCLDLEKKTFGDARVVGEVQAAFIPVKIDMTRDTERTAALAAKYGVEGLPAIVVLGPGGDELGRVRKFIPAGEMLAKLRAARKKLDSSEIQVGK